MANTFASFISTTIPAGLRKLATHTVLTRLLKPRSLLRQCGKQNNFTVTRVRKTSGGVAQLVALPQGPPEDASVWARRKPGSRSRIRRLPLQVAPMMGHSDALFTFTLHISFKKVTIRWNVRQSPFGRQNIVTLHD
jgi:hypothetical protein